jgi:hypothetical protein
MDPPPGRARAATPGAAGRVGLRAKRARAVRSSGGRPAGLQRGVSGAVRASSPLRADSRLNRFSQPMIGKDATRWRRCQRGCEDGNDCLRACAQALVRSGPATPSGIVVRHADHPRWSDRAWGRLLRPGPVLPARRERHVPRAQPQQAARRAGHGGPRQTATGCWTWSGRGDAIGRPAPTHRRTPPGRPRGPAPRPGCAQGPGRCPGGTLSHLCMRTQVRERGSALILAGIGASRAAGVPNAFTGDSARPRPRPSPGAPARHGMTSTAQIAPMIRNGP